MRGRPFEPGNRVGRGRPPGSRNKSSLLLEELQKNGAEGIRALKLKALKGDTRALIFWVAHIVPPNKPANSRFKLPTIHGAEDFVKVMPAALQAVGRGQISAQEGESIGNMLERHQQVFESIDLEPRIQVLEEKATNGLRGTPRTGGFRGSGSVATRDAAPASLLDIEGSRRSAESEEGSPNDEEQGSGRVSADGGRDDGSGMQQQESGYGKDTEEAPE
jgi:hypothetical protein